MSWIRNVWLQHFKYVLQHTPLFTVLSDIWKKKNVVFFIHNNIYLLLDFVFV